MGQQIIYLTVIVVHSTMHLMHHNHALSDNYYLIYSIILLIFIMGSMLMSAQIMMYFDSLVPRPHPLFNVCACNIEKWVWPGDEASILIF